jgi:hypothetical protein
MPGRASGLDGEEQRAGIAAFAFRLAVSGQDLAGETDEVVGMARDIGDDGTRLCQTLRTPGGIDSRAPGGAMRAGHQRRPRVFGEGRTCSCARIHASTDVRR